MNQLTTKSSLEMRKHPRAQLRMPVRLRWRGPLGMRVEVTRTIDSSRDGIRIPRSEPCEVGARVWVTFPFDASNSAPAQPETPARVVRVDQNAQRGYDVSLRLELPVRAAVRAKDKERRTCSRMTFAVPIFVRATGSPWPEESMTYDISRAGARFESAHIYATGDTVLAKIPWGEWERAGEIRARVVRVEAERVSPGPAPQSNPVAGRSGMLTSVSVRWEAQRKL
ncbi:MAG TPA: PilZ domain-containing protein [Candidatus Acidoferrales bacterium]